MTITIETPPPGRPSSPSRAAPTVIPARGAALPPSASSAQPEYLVPTLIGALAVLAATLAIPPMIVGTGWVLSTVEVVLVIWAIGVGARLARVPVVGAIILQLLGAAIALTALFTVGGFGGVIPTGAVIGEAGDLLAGAWDQIRTNVSPAPSSTELSFLICLSVGATALIVDILIAVCRAPALVALPLLCVYSVPASMDLSMLPWEAFAAPAMLYAVLLVASGLAGRRHGAGAGLAQVINGVGLAALATVIALLVAGSVTGVGTAGRLPRTASGASTGIGISPFATLEGSLRQSDPVEVMRVFGLDSPHYLRLVGLQKWTPGSGGGWSVDGLSDGDLPDTDLAAGQDQVTITSTAFRDQFLPIYNGTASLSGVGPGWTYDAALETVHRPESTTPDPYQVWASFSQPSAEQLRADSVTAGGELTETGDLSPEVLTIASGITAGQSTAFDKANALRDYFTNPSNGFTYSLTVPNGPTDDPLLNFLTNKQGFCEQYATAMAVMLRAVGVPARVAIGFTQGTLNPADGSYSITSNDSHAWVEVDFNGAGWVQFDPTPLGGGQGGQQGFTNSGQPAPTSQATAGAAPTGQGLQADELGDNSGPTAAPTASGGTGADGADNGPIVPAWIWWSLAVIALIAIAAAGPTVVRRRRRRQRSHLAEGGGPAGAAAAWREIEDLALDHGIGLNPAESARTTANRLAKAAHLNDRGRAELRAVVEAAELGWYGRADPPDDRAGIGDSALPGFDAGATPRFDAGATPGSRAGATPRSRENAMPGTGENAPPGSRESAPRASGAGPLAGTMTMQEPRPPADLAAAPRTIAAELRHTVPLSLVDRLVPRSVRPSWWRY